MGRFVVMLSFTASCLLALGCSSVGRVGSVAWLKGFGGDRTSATSEDDDNPFESKHRRRATSAGRSQYASSSSHDAQTAQYIEHELRDAAPDQRTALLDYLRPLKSSEVRTVLHTRRLQINRRKSRGQFTAPDGFSAPYGTDATNEVARPESDPSRRTTGRDNAPGRGANDWSSAGFSNAPWGAERRFEAGVERRTSADSKKNLRDSTGRYNERNPNQSYATNASLRRDTPGAGGNRSPGDRNLLPRRDPRNGGRAQQNRDGTAENEANPRTSKRDRWEDPYDARSLGSRIIPAGVNSTQRPRSDFRAPPAGTRQGGDFDESRLENRRRYELNDDLRDRSQKPFDRRLGGNSGATVHPGDRLQTPISENRSTSRVGNARFSAENRLPEFPDEWHDTLQRLIATTDSIASRGRPGLSPEEQHEHTRRQVFLRMLYLMSGRPQQSIEAIEHIDEDDQKFWQDTFFGLANYLEPELIRDPRVRATRTVASFRKAAQELQRNANLSIEQLAFCDDIRNYGNYVTFPTNEFRRGETVLVYAEIANFKSMPVKNSNMVQTLLKSQIDLFKVGARENTLVTTVNFKPTRDLCRNRRRDYFHSYKIHIPMKAGLGPHILKLIVTDEQGDKVATDTINFTIR